MPALSATMDNRVASYITGQAPADPVLPIKLALTTTIGDENTAGTEATGGSYTRQTITFGGPVYGISSNTNVVRFDGLAGGTYQAGEMFDSTGTPVRLAYAAMPSPKTVNANDAIEFPIGTIQVVVD